ncbi:MAG: 4-hydroxythreonine-4-phosphate dehydrogenase PdxA, partial [Novosphingobium sp.]|nr:4-hydroxythreonine-4-phosphate dehydrogenase PdxA [Novosphingobium sp.]
MVRRQVNGPAPLAISIGDPAGVGPELLVEAWVRRVAEGLPPFLAVGGANLLAEAADRRGISMPLETIGNPTEAGGVFGSALPVLDIGDCPYSPSEPSPEGAQLALASLTKAVDLAVSGEASGIVTGPVSKSRLAATGFTQPGQTEFVAKACGVSANNAVMMLAGPSLRTVPLTIHAALSEVPALITAELIESRARIVAHALTQDFGLPQPRLAVTGLNPHAGEDGRLGDEEQRIIAPAIARLRTDGFNVTGPHSADALFAGHERDRYDVALCMYHDQALIPIKALHFDEGVNITLGLPFVRTSPDHGTALDIA